MSSSHASAAGRRALSEINVTPFVDVMLVLLIIFMVTAPLMQQGIDVDLPETTTQPIRVRSDPLILSVKCVTMMLPSGSQVAPKLYDTSPSVSGVPPPTATRFNVKAMAVSSKVVGV